MDPAALTQELLRQFGLDTRVRNLSFLPGSIDPDLLAAVRIQVLDEAELASPFLARSVAEGASISARNDARAREVLLHACDTMLGRYGTTLVRGAHAP